MARFHAQLLIITFFLNICSYIDIEQTTASDISLASQSSGHSSDRSVFMSTSDGSYNSDHGSGYEDSRESSFVIYEENSD